MTDDKFRIVTISKIDNPNQVVYYAMHQDYSPTPVYLDKIPDERKCGEIILKKLLAGGRGHYGSLEHPQISLNCCYFPHSMVQQLRTHRVGVTFDVQSFRYTSESILKVASGDLDVSDVFYLRPVGNYRDRGGSDYFYTYEQRNADMVLCQQMALVYADKVLKDGLSEEHARGCIPFDIRQHFVMSCNARSLMHILDLRWKADAQLEIQEFSQMLFNVFQQWMPEVAEWYYFNRAKKAKLAP
jgi:thymidylate synthase (FAD)